MKLLHPITVLVALLPALSFARRGVYAGLLASRSASPVQYQAINASHTKFWIFKETDTFCGAVPAKECEEFSNLTDIFIAPELGVASMDSAVPGGQNVYVKHGGALSFTEPHEEFIYPKGAYTSGFTYTHYPKRGTDFLGFKNGSANSFFACPVKSPDVKPYQIFVNTPGFSDKSVPSGRKKDCLEIGILAVNVTKPGAYQYE